jgi:spore coat polysaccharide biosynthesis protein SpsF (cytidylyltransferase family)
VTKRTGIIIQARTGSTRFPDKVLMDLAGKPVLERVVERLLRVTGVDQIIVATTTNPADDAVAALVEGHGRCGLWRGPEDDVLARFAGAVEAFNLDVVGRVTGDCPLIDPEVVAGVLARFRATPGCDYASNCRPRSWPHGFDVEFVSRAALKVADAEATDGFDREHVLVYVFTRPERFACVNVEAGDRRHEGLRLTVDYPADLDFVRALVERLGNNWLDQGYRAIAAALEADPSLFAINAAVPAHETISGPHQRGYIRERRTQ